VYLTNLNGQGDTYAPTVTGDNQELLANANWTAVDCYTHVNSAKWDPTNSGGSFDGLAPVNALLDIDVHEGHPTVDSAGLFLVFSSERPPGYGARDLWTSVRMTRSDPWMPPTHLDALSTADDETSPSLSADGTTLYFARGPGGSMSTLTYPSIYMSTKIVTDAGTDAGVTWGLPQKVAGLDAPGSVTDFSTLFPDARTIVFSSDRATPGTEHLFLARRATVEDAFGCIQQLGSPLSDNSMEETSPFVTRDGKNLYYAVHDPDTGFYELRLSLIKVGP
jgi:Tol biopolymer transport system component